MILRVPNCSQSTKEMCVESLSVSQVASFCFALAASVNWIRATSWTGVTWVSVLTNFAIVISLFYYYLSSWFVEERLITPLRCLGGFAWVEWLARLSAFLVLLYVVFIMTSIIYIENSQTDNIGKNVYRIAWGISIMFCIYLFWDAILFFCLFIIKMEEIEELKEELLSFIKTDIPGLLAGVMLILSSRLSNPVQAEVVSRSTQVGFLAGLSCALLIIPVVLCKGARKYTCEVSKRLFNRLAIR